MTASRATPTPLPSTDGVMRVARPYLPPTEAIVPYYERIDAARWYSNFGPLVNELEARLSARCSDAAVCTVANATQGMTLALRALTQSPGLCLMPGFTFVATAHAAAQARLKPYFMDVDPDTFMATPQDIRAALAAAPGPVSAIIVVSAFGAPIEVEPLVELQSQIRIPIILDAAAAFDSVRDAPLPTVVSLHATKILGAGEGGYVIGAPDFIAKVRGGSSFGFLGAREARMVATNAKMSEYAAAVALASLDNWDATRMRFLLAARKLRIATFRAQNIAFQRGWGERWITSTCVVKAPPGQAQRLADHLSANAIATCAWYGPGLHREPAFSAFPHGDLRTVEQLASSTLGIPFAIDLSDDDIERLAAALIEF